MRSSLIGARRLLALASFASLGLAALIASPVAAQECPGEGSCLIPNLTPGCEDEACCLAVCEFDLVCCFVSWDQGCVDLAVKLCETCPGPGGCLVFNGSPGCEDAACCEAVCAVLPLCCQVQWDGICAGEAMELCGDICLGDLNGDLVVDVQDLVQVIVDFGCTGGAGDCPGDVDSDGDVDVSDIVFLILSWGECP